LLRRDISRRAEDHPWRKGDLTGVRAVRNAEVHQVDGSLVVETNVCRLDIAMDNALVMCIGQCFGQLRHDFRGSFKRKRVLNGPLGQAVSLNQGHRDVGPPAGRAGLINWHDSGMSQPRECLGLTQETIERLGRLQHALAGYLESDVTFQDRVIGAINRGMLSLPQNPYESKAA
jgi:hypothetical protein